jgi:glycine oxidase
LLQDNNIYIIGQGIAGSVLAFLMHQSGLRVRVYDDEHKSSASKVAAGMWNPVSFKRMSQSWIADDLLPVADSIYRNMEATLGAQFYHPMELVKVFPDTKFANMWDEHSMSAEVGHYLTSQQDEVVKAQFHQPNGHGVVSNAGWLDIPTLLTKCKEYFVQHDMYEQCSIDQSFIDELLAKDKQALIIFATGPASTALFSDKVRIILNKGEVLTVRIKDLPMTRIANFGKFLIPMGNDLFRLGATYEWKPAPLDITDKSRDVIMNQLANHYKGQVEIVNQLAGYRPTTKDRRPMIGKHPQNDSLVFFNGFGSKGVMLIPYFAQHVIEYLEGKTSLLREVDVMRCFREEESM